jgi:isopentenyl-diphosphate delta-isomerase
MKEYLILVNDKNEQIGVMPKLEAHNANTPLHRAFSCYVFNQDGKFLLTQRALSKKVFPGIWSNSCCGHPAPGEEMEDAIGRRLSYELGLKPNTLTLVISHYQYRVEMNGIFEHEICPVYIATVNQDPKPNPKEIEEYKWIEWKKFLKIIEKKPKNYSPWCIEQSELLDSKKLFLSNI